MEKLWDWLTGLTKNDDSIFGVILTILSKAIQVVFFMIFAALFLPAYLIVTYGHKLWAKMLTELLKL